MWYPSVSRSESISASTVRGVRSLGPAGDSFMAQADKKLKSFGFFGNKYEEAAELLEKAANNYKLGKARGRRAALRCAACARAAIRTSGLQLDGCADVIGCRLSRRARGGERGLCTAPQQHPTRAPRLCALLKQAWKQAAEAYRQLASVHVKLDSKHDAASCYVEGAKALMKVAPAEAVLLLQQARRRAVAWRGCALSERGPGCGWDGVWGGAAGRIQLC
jgi:hypothetical protein